MENKFIDYNSLFKQEVEANGFIVLKKNEMKEVAKIFTEAFDQYPIYRYFSKKYNYKDWLKWNTAVIKALSEYGVVFTDSTRSLCGVMCCNKYDIVTRREIYRNGGWKSLFTLGKKALDRVFKFEDFAMELRRKYAIGDYIYCYDICLKKEAQGKGLGKQVIKIAKEFCDKYRIDLYLETHTASNVIYYKKQGFDLLEEAKMPDTDIVNYCFMYKHKTKDK